MAMLPNEPPGGHTPVQPVLAARDVQSRTLRGSLWGLVAAAAGVPLAVVSTVVLTRTLSPRDFGRYALLAFLVPTAISLTDLGATNAFLQRGAAALGAGDKETLRRTCGQATTWSLARWPALVVASAFLFRDVLAVVLISVVGVVAVVCAGKGIALLSSIRNADLARIYLLANTLGTATTVLLAVQRSSPERVFLGGMAVHHLAMILQLRLDTAGSVRTRDCLRPARLTGLAQDLRFGSGIYASQTMTNLALGRSELAFFGAGQVQERAVYAGAFTMASRLTLPFDALFGALAPGLSAITADDDAWRAGRDRSLRLSGGLFTLLAGPLLFLVVVGADLLFPSSYAGLGEAAVLLAGASLLVSSCSAIPNIHFASRRVAPLLVAAGVGLAVNVAVCVLLIPAFGLAGAVAANVIGALVYSVALLIPMAVGADGAAARRFAAVVLTSLGSATTIAVAATAIDSRPARWVGAALGGLAATLLVARLGKLLLPSDVAAAAGALPARLSVPLVRLLAGATIPLSPHDPVGAGEEHTDESP